MKRDVFISYQHNDSLFAHALCAELESRGISCWIATTNIDGGASWSAEIVSALKSTRSMILVFSSHTHGSEHVKNELSLAVNHGKTVIPILLEDIKPQGEFEFYLTRRHWVQAFGGAKGRSAKRRRR